MTSLVVVESEAKAKALRDQVGEVYEPLVLPSAPMRVSHDPKSKRLYTGEVGFHFVPAENRKEFVKALLASMNNEIYLALDTDQRGEYWSWMVGMFLLNLSTGAKTARRVQVTGFTKDEILSSFSHVAPLQNAAAASLYIRSLFNNSLVKHIRRLLGTDKGPAGLPLHYNSLTTLFLLEEREAKIAPFSSTPKWHVLVRVAGPGGEFDVSLQEAYGVSDDGLLTDTGEVAAAQSLFENQPFRVEKVEECDFVRQPPVPCGLPELIQHGMTQLAMTPRFIVRTLQKLFHGIDVDGKISGLISSPFQALPADTLDSVVERIRQAVLDQYGQDALMSRDIDGAVILPLRPDVSAEDLSDVLTEEEGKLYEMVRCRCLASQMKDAGGNTLTATLSAGKCLFQASLPNVEERGFLQAYDLGYNSSLLEPCPLVGVEAGQEFAVKQIVPEQASNVGQELYTLETLLDDLLDFSIQCESSTIAMLQDMLDKGYVSIDAHGYLHCGANSAKVISTINRAFPGMMGIHLAAYFEQTVNEVTSGRKPFDFAMTQFEQNFIMHGTPLVKVAIPKSVPRRTKRSKNIIKSRGPIAAKPVLEDISAPAVEPPPVSDDEPAVEITSGQGGEQATHPPEVIAEEHVEAKEQAEARDADSQDVSEQHDVAVEQSEEDLSEGVEQGAEPEKVLAGDPVRPVGVDGEVDEIAAEVLEENVPSGPAEDGEAVFEHASGSPSSVEPVDEQSDTEIAAETRECPDCGNPLLLKQDRFGKYWACSRYPACRHSESYAMEEEKLKLLCPLCAKGDVTIKRTPTGKKLYVCPDGSCEFMAWSLPHAIVCPDCGSPFLVEKKGSGGRQVLRCPRAGCSFQQPLAGQAGEGESPKGEQDALPKKKKVLVRRKKGRGGTTKKKRVVVRRKKK